MLTDEGAELEVTPSEYWDARWHGEPIPSYDIGDCYFQGLKSMMDTFLPRVVGPNGTSFTIIDVGCGNGLMLRFFKEQFNADVTGIDYSDVWIAAREMSRTLALNIHVEKLDLMDDTRLGQLGQFDVVSSFGLIEHFRDPLEPMRRLARLARPGGCLLTVIPNFHGLFDFLWRTYDSSNYAHHVPIRVPELLDLGRRAGLDCLEVWGLGGRHLPGVHDQSRVVGRITARVIRSINDRLWKPLPPQRVSGVPGLRPNVCLIGFKQQ